METTKESGVNLFRAGILLVLLFVLLPVTQTAHAITTREPDRSFNIGDMTELEQRLVVTSLIFSTGVFDSANESRLGVGLPPLLLNQNLVASARLKASNMADGGYFAHTSPGGKTPWYWFGQSGYKFLYAGENLAINYSNSKSVNNAWMNSPSHRGNILNKNYTEIGIATARGMYQGEETFFIVQLFGSPASSLVRPVVL